MCRVTARDSDTLWPFHHVSPVTRVHRTSQVVFINACCCACQHVFMWDAESFVVAGECYLFVTRWSSIFSGAKPGNLHRPRVMRCFGFAQRSVVKH